jgi:pyruvate dehydrogenase E2 component (dihydrolipoamide acetyltransferase)
MGKQPDDFYNPPWRQTAVALYRTPVDGRIYGIHEFEINDVIQYIEDSKKRGTYITITAIFAACLARSLAFDTPELNCFIHRGRVVPRKEVSVLVVASNNEGREIDAIKITDAHLKTASQITHEIQVRVKDSRADRENNLMQNKQMLARIPWPFRIWFVRFVRWLFVEMGVELKPFGLSHSAFGSILLSNIGTFGLHSAMPALLPFSKLPVLAVLGEAKDKPVVRDSEIVIRRMIPVTATFDHRIVDGALAGKIVKSVLRYLNNPEALDQKPVV